MKSALIDIVFAEFNGLFPIPYDNIRKFFPEADIRIYTSASCEDVFGNRSKFPERWGNHMNDYWKVKRLLDSEAEIAISMDADMKIMDERVRTIIPLVKKFGVCLPVNPRGTVRKDTLIGSHSDKALDDTAGMAHAVNMTPIAFDTSNSKARYLLEKYCDIIKDNPVRGTLAMWRAIYATGFMPCLLPVQWCVCAENVGVGDEIILHIGHDKVRDYYAS
jgi:hypothetical protein